jgi:ABC-type glycerol-3-phosphate transport system permease component
MSAAAMALPGEGGAARREASFVAAIVLTVFWLAPIAIMIMNASKTKQDFLLSTALTPPHSFAFFDNVARAWAKGLSSGFFNSVVYGLCASACAVVLSALAAYGIVRLRIPWGLFWFLLIYSGTIFPFQMYLIPLFNLYLDTGLYDTRIGMIAFYIAITIPFCTFVMRGFFLTVPWDIQEAAEMEGASSWKIFWYIMMPLAKAPFLMLTLVQFTWVWNDLLFGMVLVRSPQARSVQVALLGMQSLYGQADAPTIITATLIVSLPTLLLFLLLQKHFVRGLALGATGN